LETEKIEAGIERHRQISEIMGIKGRNKVRKREKELSIERVVRKSGNDLSKEWVGRKSEKELKKG